LNNRSVLNTKSTSSGYAELIADDNFIQDADWLGRNASPADFIYAQNYIWLAQAHPIYDVWSNIYDGPIYYANVVLDQLPRISVPSKDSSLAKSVRGQALFFRSFAFWSLAQVYCRPYATEYFSLPGVLLRLTSDVGVVSHQRATVEECYDRIVADLKEAASLLPLNTIFPTQPNQTAAYAMLARVYLSMRDYTNAGYYADLAIQQKANLLDYNTVVPTSTITFPVFNTEVIFDNVPVSTLDNSNFSRADTNLYQSYDVNDLRKTLFFKKVSFNNYYYFFGSYNSKVYNYSDNTWDGLATDELYLTRAECSARAGLKDSALNDLNRLIIKRWKSTVSYPTITANTAAEALTKVLAERRKELFHRGLRWTDVRRFNLEGVNITLQRVIQGVTYTLPPNDPRTVMLIPIEEINQSGIEQNSR
jgi:tetratricopeptide (TPR) repeat protein